jgi:hypothetical protein
MIVYWFGLRDEQHFSVSLSMGICACARREIKNYVAVENFSAICPIGHALFPRMGQTAPDKNKKYEAAKGVAHHGHPVTVVGAPQLVFNFQKRVKKGSVPGNRTFTARQLRMGSRSLRRRHATGQRSLSRSLANFAMLPAVTDDSPSSPNDPAPAQAPHRRPRRKPDTISHFRKAGYHGVG